MRINRIMVLGLVATCLLASCKKEDNVPEDGFLATIEQNGGGNNSRTHIDPDSWKVGANVGVLWTKDDLIKVASGSGNTLTFQLTEGENKKNGTFYTGENHDGFFQPNYVAIYPAQNAEGAPNTINISDFTATFNLPDTQTYQANSFAEKSMPMVAYSTTQNLQFKNVLGCICLSLVGNNMTVTKIVLTSNTPDDKLWGTCTTTISTSGGAPSSTMAGDSGSNSITLECDGGVSLHPENPTYFCIIVPPGTLANGFKVEMYNGNTKLNEASTPTDANIRRNVISKTGKITVAEPVPVFTEKPFSVASGSTVCFSPGNLQCIRSESTPYWKFADNQWDVLGTTTGQNSSNQNVDRDLFGWATSGWENMPWTTTQSNDSYYIEGQGKDMTGTHADWGVHNSIYNPKTNHTDAAGTWRTLTNAEWTYLFTRNTPSGICYAKANVNYVNGVILLPDDWSASYYSLSNTNQSTASYSSNVISSAQWNTLEQHGAVFLPAAGYRDGTSVSEVGGNGYYWSSKHTQDSHEFGAYALNFSDGAVTPNFMPTYIYSFYGYVYNLVCRYYGYSVRLVRNVP